LALPRDKATDNWIIGLVAEINDALIAQIYMMRSSPTIPPSQLYYSDIYSIDDELRIKEVRP